MGIPFLRALALAVVLAVPAHGSDAEAPAMSEEERAEVLDVVGRFDRAFAAALDVEPLLGSDPLSRPEAVALADTDDDLGNALRGDAGRLRRLVLLHANAALMADLICLATCDLSDPDLPGDHPYPKHVRSRIARFDRAVEALDRATSLEEALRRIDRYLDAGEALLAALREAFPADAVDGWRYGTNLRWLEEDGRLTVHRSESDDAYDVVRGRVHFVVARTDAGLAIVFVEPASD